MKHMPLMPRMNFPPQPVMDSAGDDGPISVAFGMRKSVRAYVPTRPCPNTWTYPDRRDSLLLERRQIQPRQGSDVCGYIQAAASDADLAANNEEKERMGVTHNEMRLVYGSISGWTLLLWQTQQDFQEGLHGEKRAPRPIAWFDLREAYDVNVDFGDYVTEICPHRVRVMMPKGHLFFRVEHPEDVPVWFSAIRSLIMDSTVAFSKTRDSKHLQSKRWPAAKGLARELLSGRPIGERALAIAFHCYDIDYDSSLRLGEIMILIQELLAAMLADVGRAEGGDRDTAVMSASARIPEEELFERAMRFRRRCGHTAGGRVKKDAFIINGHEAMLEAMDLAPGVHGGGGESSCSVM